MVDISSYSNEVIKRIFEQQRKELTDSMLYASYIQKALLPSEGLIKRCFPEYFLLYIPRVVVSGDFYWIARKRNLTYLALADSTGHGVPGAFLSILGITFLNQIVDRNEFINAASVLNNLREYIMKALNQTGEIDEQKDGIDMALCIIDEENNMLQYAGAMNPIYHVKKADSALVEIPADRMPIGISIEQEHPFTNHQVALNDGDMVYLFTDGYADQFGGREGKKFKYKPFRELLIKNSQLPAEQQKEKIFSVFDNWRGEQDQIDDVSVFGFRYSKK